MDTMKPNADAPFATRIERSDGELIGPWREPRQMLAEQSYDDHASIHDDETARKLGFQGGTIEGPTHFSQFAPLCFALWGARWFESGCISGHYRTAAYEGEKVRARVAEVAADGASSVIWMEKEDGSEVLRGTASVGPHHPPTELDQRVARLTTPTDLVVLEGVRVGTRGERLSVRMAADQHMGRLYPFTLNQKLERITEPSPLYLEGNAGSSPFGRAIIPMEMISVLVNHVSGETPFYTKGPVVGLFADQEIRLVDGPLFVGETYEIDREVVAISGSRRTESLWILTRIYRPGSDGVIASMLLNSALLKDSYAGYEAEHRRLYGGA
jgi:hypothetical protein